MSNFIHGPEVRHSPIDLESVANVTLWVREDDKYEHVINFYTKQGKGLESWYFKNSDKPLATLTFTNIKNELGSKDINDTVKL
jgi:hypothetical protein